MIVTKTTVTIHTTQPTTIVVEEHKGRNETASKTRKRTREPVLVLSDDEDEEEIQVEREPECDTTVIPVTKRAKLDEEDCLYVPRMCDTCGGQTICLKSVGRNTKWRVKGHEQYYRCRASGCDTYMCKEHVNISHLDGKIYCTTHTDNKTFECQKCLRDFPQDHMMSCGSCDVNMCRSCHGLLGIDFCKNCALDERWYDTTFKTCSTNVAPVDTNSPFDEDEPATHPCMIGKVFGHHDYDKEHEGYICHFHKYVLEKSTEQGLLYQPTEEDIEALPPKHRPAAQ